MFVFEWDDVADDKLQCKIIFFVFTIQSKLLSTRAAFCQSFKLVITFPLMLSGKKDKPSNTNCYYRSPKDIL